LIDQFINHFGDWWLIGVKDTASWGWDMWDTQNQYVNVGETGGLVALVWFIAMISRCFGRLGDARKAIAGDRRQEAYAWLLGAALFAHVVGFFGVNYFDQTRVAWLFLLAVISVKTIPTIPVSTVAEPRPMDFVTGATPPVGALEKHGHEALMFARFEGY
jgi:O-antigen ligase